MSTYARTPESMCSPKSESYDDVVGRVDAPPNAPSPQTSSNVFDGCRTPDTDGEGIEGHVAYDGTAALETDTKPCTRSPVATTTPTTTTPTSSSTTLTTATSTTLTTTTLTTTTSTPPDPPTKPPRRRPIPRKGHTKSRHGCYNCKRRKVKCPEDTPYCQQCHRLGLKCEYPPPKVAPRYSRSGGGSGSGAIPTPATTMPGVLVVPIETVASTASSIVVAPARSLDSAPLFCLDDMRFMQHFLAYGHPSMPIGDPSVWYEVGKMAHEYEFLMHSILGLAAFHLNQFVPNRGYGRQALHHRLKALKQINEFIASPRYGIADGDAAFGAVMALIYQSIYMEDAMLEYITMIRGCYLVLMQAMPDWSLSRFQQFTDSAGHNDPSTPVLTVHYKLKNESAMVLPPPLYHTTDARDFHNSIGAVIPHCNSSLQYTFLLQMQRAVRAAQIDAVAGFREASLVYNRFGQMTGSEFDLVTDTKNAMWQVILAHFVLVDYIIGAHLSLAHFNMRNGNNIPNHPVKGRHDRRVITARWVLHIWKGLEHNPDMRRLVEWPVEFVGWMLDIPRDVRPLGLPASCAQ